VSAARDRARARRFFAALDRWERGELGDALVLGIDHLDWFGERVSSVFLAALDEERITWEQTL
jgi:hypothetical protein